MGSKRRGNFFLLHEKYAILKLYLMRFEERTQNGVKGENFSFFIVGTKVVVI